MRLVGHKGNWANLYLGCGLAACQEVTALPRRTTPHHSARFLPHGVGVDVLLVLLHISPLRNNKRKTSPDF
jgi:hypothetical protein